MTSSVRLPDGRGLDLWEGGDPGGRPVVFFHGCPDSRLAAVPGDEAARVAGARLVAFSRPGYGGSDPGESDHVSVADDTPALADALGIGSFAVLGMSIGAGYALACAARHPDRVSSAAVVSAAGDVTRMDPPVPRDGLDEGGRAFFARLAGSSVEAAVASMRPDFTAYVAAAAPQDPDDRAVAARFRARLDDTDRRVAEGWSDALVARSMRESLASHEGYLRDAATTFRPWRFDLAAVACPVAVLHGRHDRQHSPRNAEWLSSTLSGATLTLLDEGHLGALHRHWPEIVGTLH